MVLIKDLLLLIEKGLPMGVLSYYLNGPLPYAQCHITVNKMSHLSSMLIQRPWYVLFCLWDDAYKRTLAANRKE